MRPGPLVAPLLVAGLLAVGAATGLATVLAHELWWGLPLATAAVAATFVWVGRGWTTRLPFALGFVAAVLVVLPARPEGDYLVASSPRGYALLLLTLLVLVFALATLPRPRRAPGPGRLGETTYDGARD